MSSQVQYFLKAIDALSLLNSRLMDTLYNYDTSYVKEEFGGSESDIKLSYQAIVILQYGCTDSETIVHNQSAIRLLKQ